LTFPSPSLGLLRFSVEAVQECEICLMAVSGTSGWLGQQDLGGHSKSKLGAGREYFPLGISFSGLCSCQCTLLPNECHPKGHHHEKDKNIWGFLHQPEHADF